MAETNLLDQSIAGVAPIACNPLLLSIPNYEHTAANVSANGHCQSSSGSTSLYDSEFQSSMHINRMFDEAHEHVNILSLALLYCVARKHFSAFILDDQ